MTWMCEMLWKQKLNGIENALAAAGWTRDGDVLPDNGSDTMWFVNKDGNALKVELNDGDPREEIEDEEFD